MLYYSLGADFYISIVSRNSTRSLHCYHFSVFGLL